VCAWQEAEDPRGKRAARSNTRGKLASEGAEDEKGKEKRGGEVGEAGEAGGQGLGQGKQGVTGFTNSHVLQVGFGVPGFEITHSAGGQTDGQADRRGLSIEKTREGARTRGPAERERRKRGKRIE
jgi:hypothetical protein